MMSHLNVKVSKLLYKTSLQFNKVLSSLLIACLVLLSKTPWLFIGQDPPPRKFFPLLLSCSSEPPFANRSPFRVELIFLISSRWPRLVQRLSELLSSLNFTTMSMVRPTSSSMMTSVLKASLKGVSPMKIHLVW